MNTLFGSDPPGGIVLTHRQIPVRKNVNHSSAKVSSLHYEYSTLLEPVYTQTLQLNSIRLSTDNQGTTVYCTEIEGLYQSLRGWR